MALINDFRGIFPVKEPFFWSCKATKNREFGLQAISDLAMKVKGFSSSEIREISSTSNVRSKMLKFLKGI